VQSCLKVFPLVVCADSGWYFRPAIVSDFTQAQCRALAEKTRDLDYAGVVGREQTAPWFAERAIELGASIPTAGRPPVPQLS
jgi:hypothetical protein